MKQIVLVEDLSDWLEEARIALRELGDVKAFSWESEFMQAISSFDAAPPALFVIDCMLPWSEPSPTIPIAPREVMENGYHGAGIRCQAELSKIERLKNIPVIFWTLLTLDDLKKEFPKNLPSNCYHISKREGIEGLVEQAKLAMA